MDTVKPFFLLHEVVVLSGFTKYMLDYLAREDIFRASGAGYGTRGRRRRYSFEDVVLLRALHRVCRAKGKIRKLRGALAALRGEVGPLVPGQPLDRVVHLEGDELTVWVRKDVGRHVRTGQLTFGFLLDLGTVVDELGKVLTFDSKLGTARLTPSAAAQAESVRQACWARVRTSREARA